MMRAMKVTWRTWAEGEDKMLQCDMIILGKETTESLTRSDPLFLVIPSTPVASDIPSHSAKTLEPVP